MEGGVPVEMSATGEYGFVGFALAGVAVELGKGILDTLLVHQYRL